MNVRIKPVTLTELADAARTLFRDAVMSPLRKYVVYSLVIHVVLISLFSVGTIITWVRGEDPAARPAQETATAGNDAAAGADAGTTPPAKDTAKPGEGDYYKRAGIETAKPEEIPRNPFEAKGEIDKALKGLE